MPLSKIIPAADSATPDSLMTTQQKVVEFIQNLNDMSTEELLNYAITSVSSIATKIASAIVIYIIGRWLINRLAKFMNKIFINRQVEVSLAKFIISLTKISLNIILILTVIGVLGINTTSFLAIFASAGLAIGMALSGTLQNFAGGVMILFLKPYKIGDVIEAQGYTGTVKEISLFSTLLNTIDNKMVIIPNGGLSTGIINNFSKEDTRRVEWTFGVAYGTDSELVKATILDELSKNQYILKDHELFVALTTLGDSSVNFVVRAWSNSGDYWSLYFTLNDQIYKRFNNDGIEFPFPQLSVHLPSNNPK